MQSDFQAPPLRNDGGMALPGKDAVGGAPSDAGSGAALPDSVPYPDAPAPGSGAPPAAGAPPRALPTPGTPAPGSGPSGGAGSGIPASPSDQTPIPAPELESNAFARVDNCRLVTPPSGYQAASVARPVCGPVYPAAYTCPTPQTPPAAAPAPTTLPAEIPAPATLPPVSVYPSTPAPAAPAAAAPARALISFGQEQNVVQVGQGLWGQPVAYVPGQHVRNWLRYFSP